MGYNLSDIYLTADNIISSLGFTTKENFDSIRHGRSGISLNKDKSITDSPILAGTIYNKKLQIIAQRNYLRKYSKLEQLIILSVKGLLLQTQIDLGSSDCAMIISTTKGNIELLENQTNKLNEKVFLGNIATSIASYFGLEDRITTLSNACISGVSAIIVAQRLIQTGTYRHVVVVGVDTLSHFITSGFRSFKSMAESICKPFDADRDGLNIGEACGSILLSSKHQPKAVRLRGGAISNDANHISGPSRTGDGLLYAIQGAMNDADVSANDIDFINLHGTATIFNDEMEAKAVNLAGLQNAPVNSSKPYFGHTLGASGIIETIICVHELKNGIIFGTPNYANPGVSQPLKVSANHIENPTITTCLKTASGFGGCNAAIVLSLTPRPICEMKQTSSFEFEELRTCRISNSSIELDNETIFSSASDDFSIFIREAFKALNESYLKFYKMDDLCKLGYITAAHLLKDLVFEPQEIGIILSNKSASLDTDIKHQKTIDADGGRAASPATFVYTLPNIVAGEICIRHKIQGENTFFIDNIYNKEDLQQYVELAMTKGKLRFCIYGVCEYLDNQYKAEFILLEKTEIWKN